MEFAITIGDILTVAAILVSATGLILSHRATRQQATRIEAQRIRDSLGSLLAKLARWAEITGGLHARIQPALVTADASAVSGSPPRDIRDRLWTDCWIAHEAVESLIIEENIETAYANLYGYDERVYKLYVTALQALRDVSGGSFSRLIEATQDDVVETVPEAGPPPSSTELGNRLRRTVAVIEHDHRERMGAIVRSFEEAVRPVLAGTDQDLVDRGLDIEVSDYLTEVAEARDTDVQQRLDSLKWSKSALSSSLTCVEWNVTDDQVLLRNSGSPTGPVLEFSPEAWQGFVTAAARGDVESSPPDKPNR